MYFICMNSLMIVFRLYEFLIDSQLEQVSHFLDQISNIYFHSSGSNMGLKLLVVSPAIKYLIEKTLWPDILEFILAKNHFYATFVLMLVHKKDIWSHILSIITIKLLNPCNKFWWLKYFYDWIWNLYFCFSGSNLGRNLLLVQFVTTTHQTERPMLFDMSKFIWVKNHIYVNIAIMQQHRKYNWDHIWPKITLYKVV